MNHSNWPLAPHWALQAGSAGRLLIIAALVGYLATIFGWSIAPKKPLFGRLASWTFALSMLCLFGAIFCLGSLFVNNQFEYPYVFSHGDADTQLRYKIAGIWSGQQGSFLLWACTSSLFTTIAAFRLEKFRRWFSITASAFLATLCGILSYETPFTLGINQVPPNGAGLTPSLQNYWVVIHPPTIFSGFGMLLVLFSIGAAALFTKDAVSYVPKLRPWALLTTAFLGLGLCFGGFWAYETLGWGGFWMWDPVENVSFVPWILSIALVHGLIVQSAKRQWIGPNLLLTGIPFVSFCYGTFLTRSGFLDSASVHSFAEMNNVALKILLATVIVFTVGYIGLYIFRGRALAAQAEGEPTYEPGIDRQKAYSSAVILLCGLASATAIGMSVPFFMALAHHTGKVVDEPLYDKVVVWFYIPIMLLVGCAPFLSWRKDGFKASAQRLFNVAAVTLGLLGLVVYGFRLIQGGDRTTVSFPFHQEVALLPWMVVLAGVGLFAAVSNIWRMIEIVRRAPLSIGGFIAHLGISVLLSGLIISKGFEKKERVFMQEGDTVSALGYTMKYAGMTHDDVNGGLFLADNKVKIDVDGPDGKFEARPGLYYIENDPTRPGQLTPVVWPHLQHFPLHDVYLTLYAPQLDLWDAPVTFQLNQTLAPTPGLKVTYNGFKMVGTPGQAGTQFVADATVAVEDVNNDWKTYHVQPALTITQDGPQPTFPPIGSEFVMTLDGIDAATHAATMSVHLQKAIYPIDFIYKPLVGMVWLGAGITFLGGLLAAWYRRAPRPKRDLPPRPKLSDDDLLDRRPAASENKPEALV